MWIQMSKATSLAVIPQPCTSDAAYTWGCGCVLNTDHDKADLRQKTAALHREIRSPPLTSPYLYGQSQTNTVTPTLAKRISTNTADCVECQSAQFQTVLHHTPCFAWRLKWLSCSEDAGYHPRELLVSPGHFTRSLIGSKWGRSGRQSIQF